MRKGFTLIEMLIVVAIVAILFSVVAPMSINMYRSYMASQTAEKMLILLSQIRRHSFLYSEEYKIECKKGKLYINDKLIKLKDKVVCKTDKPIVFYNNGTSSGGDMKLDVSGFYFTLKVKSPFGAISMENG
ncbi:prepilin-type N-terminal cleavage/methylation domain-containing protein [Hydrogenobaculum sp.]|nr:MAG: prepilin-type cleavage/methylation domain-containing protein [Hydrogenobaculum sp.]HEK25141.1 type II secretion system protein [Hydrogenobaculum sp.]